jgi:hypothetical protein
MITTGSVRGWCWAPQRGHVRRIPPSATVVGAPQTEQWRWPGAGVGRTFATPGDHRPRAAVGVGVDREHGTVGIEAEQQRLRRVERGQRHERQPLVLGQVDAVIAGEHGAGRRIGRLRGDPRCVAAMLGRAVKLPAGERDAHTG